MKTLKNKVFSGVAWSLLDKVINQAGSFILLIYLSRVLSPSDFGLIAMLAIFLAISQSLIDSGFSQALIQKSTKVTEADLSTVFYINIIISILMYIFLYFSAPIISSFYQQPELNNLSRVLFLVVIINSIAIVPRSCLSIDMNFKHQSITNTISMIISSIVAIFMVTNGGGYWSLVGMALSKSIVNATLLISLSNWYPKLLFSKQSFQSLFGFGWKLLLAGLLATVTQNLNTILIGKYFSPKQVGLYQQAHNFTNILSSTISSIVQGVTYPLMTSIQDEREKLRNIYVKVMEVTVFITFPFFVGFAAISEEFVLLFLGEKWELIIPILAILSIARSVTPISALNLNILNAIGRSDLFLKADIVKIPIFIILLLIAVQYGIMAVAIAQLVFTLISFFINTYYPGKLFGFGAKEQLAQLTPILIASIIMFFAIAFIEVDDLLLQMILKIVVGVILYVGICWLFKFTLFQELLNAMKNR